jgi:hypothetical protein
MNSGFAVGLFITVKMATQIRAPDKRYEYTLMQNP